MMKIALPNLLMSHSRDRTASDVEEELQFHVQMLERKFTQEGMSEAHAKAAALKRFGNLERAKRQCVDISRRNNLLRRVLKASSIPIALIGLVIHALSSDYKVARIGQMLITIVIIGRLLLYVRGLSPWTFLPRPKERSASVFTNTPDDGALT